MCSLHHNQVLAYQGLPDCLSVFSLIFVEKQNDMRKPESNGKVRIIKIGVSLKTAQKRITLVVFIVCNVLSCYKKT